MNVFPRHQGDLVQLKEVPTGTSNELKSKAMDHLVMAHGLRHENINPLIGNDIAKFRRKIYEILIIAFPPAQGGWPTR